MQGTAANLKRQREELTQSLTAPKKLKAHILIENAFALYGYDHIISQMLNKLTLTDLVHANLVCKTWHQVAQNFIKKQRAAYVLDYASSRNSVWLRNLGPEFLHLFLTQDLPGSSARKLDSETLLPEQEIALIQQGINTLTELRVSEPESTFYNLETYVYELVEDLIHSGHIQLLEQVVAFDSLNCFGASSLKRLAGLEALSGSPKVEQVLAQKLTLKFDDFHEQLYRNPAIDEETSDEMKALHLLCKYDCLDINQILTLFTFTLQNRLPGKSLSHMKIAILNQLATKTRFSEFCVSLQQSPRVLSKTSIRMRALTQLLVQNILTQEQIKTLLFLALEDSSERTRAIISVIKIWLDEKGPPGEVFYNEMLTEYIGINISKAHTSNPFFDANQQNPEDPPDSGYTFP